MAAHATVQALHKAEQAFRALEEFRSDPDVGEKLKLLLQIQHYVLQEDATYRCIETLLQKFLALRHEQQPVPLRRYLGYLIEQIACRKPKMALRCVGEGGGSEELWWRSVLVGSWLW